MRESRLLCKPSFPAKRLEQHLVLVNLALLLHATPAFLDASPKAERGAETATFGAALESGYCASINVSPIDDKPRYGATNTISGCQNWTRNLPLVSITILSIPSWTDEQHVHPLVCSLLEVLKMVRLLAEEASEDEDLLEGAHSF